MPRNISTDLIENKIFQIRGKRVMLDSDLSQLYQVPTKILIQAVKRHVNRFPRDFMFLVTYQEVTNLRSQIVTSSWGGRRHLPYAFTEQGVAMLSSVLNSPRAIYVNIQIMRAFVSLKRECLTYLSLKRKIETMEGKYDRQFKIVFEAIKRLLEPIPEKKGKIGFHT